MNWGKGLTIAMVLFMGFILTMVFSMISRGVELDNPDYYKRDLAYNGEIEAMNRVQNMTEQIELKRTEDAYTIKIPSDQFITDVSVFFSRPNDESQDFVVEVGDKRMEKISLNKLTPGYYNIEVRFFAKGKACLQKERIYV